MMWTYVRDVGIRGIAVVLERCRSLSRKLVRQTQKEILEET